jgi:hypothetical protein
MQHSSAGYGENLAMGHSSFSAAFMDWYNEVSPASLLLTVWGQLLLAHLPCFSKHTMQSLLKRAVGRKLLRTTSGHGTTAHPDRAL